MIPHCHNIYISTSAHFSPYSWLVFVITYTSARQYSLPPSEWFIIVMRYTLVHRCVGTVSSKEWILIAIPYEAARRHSRLFLVDNTPKWQHADTVELLLTLCYSIKNWRPVSASARPVHCHMKYLVYALMRWHILKCDSTWHSIVFSP